MGQALIRAFVNDGLLGLLLKLVMRFDEQDDDTSFGRFPLIATASPNPFSNTLDIFPNNPAAASITLQMYNLSGQKVLDQQFSGGQEQYSLSTEGLATGFYFLRIEADGEVQTLKVVKSE